MKIFLIFCYHILLGLGLGFETVEHAKYCVSDSPLDTRYFVPFYKVSLICHILIYYCLLIDIF